MTDETEDAWSRASVHGVAPLVAAPDGLRFADALDPPSAYLVDPADLPDAEVTVRTFDHPVSLAAFVSGVREAGSNAATVTAMAGERPTAALLVRRDRGRPHGATPADCVLHRHGADGGADPAPYLAAIAAGRRAEAGRRRAVSDSAAWEGEWRAEMAALSGNRSAQVDVSRPRGPGEPLWLCADDTLMAQGNRGLFLRVTRVPEGLLVTRDLVGMGALEDDVSRDLAAATSAAGLAPAGGGHVGATVANLDAGTVGGLRESFRALDVARDVAARRSAARARCRKVLDDAQGARILASALAGFPVVSVGTGQPRQVDPGTGRVAPRGLFRVAGLASAGILRPLKLGEGAGAPRAYLLTDAGRALARGDVAGAGDILAAGERRRDDAPGTLAEALLAGGEADLPPRIAGAVSARFEDGAVVGPARGEDAGTFWALAAAGVAAGVLAHDGAAFVPTDRAPSPGA